MSDEAQTERFTIQVIDPGKKLTAYLEKSLADCAVIERVETADTALQILALERRDLVVLQLKLQIFSGIEFARRLRKVRPEIPVLAVGRPTSAEDGEEFFRLGYPPPTQWPVEDSELVTRCRQILTGEVWLRRARAAKEELKKNYGFDQILSLSQGMRSVHERLKRVVSSRVPVLINGESGTGKELVARMVHSTGERAKKPFITVNCAAVPEGLLESQFFGHEKGAFTGATGRTPGRFEVAHTGTLFLDEVGELSPALQAKLLRVLEYGEFERVGGVETIKVDVRLVTATNRSLEQMVAMGTFRNDLYYRINVFPIQLPPLRERGDDVTLLAYHFLTIASGRNNRQVRAIQPEALELLCCYPWPGNIRELENAIERALLLSDGVRLRPEDFPVQNDWVELQSVEAELEESNRPTRMSRDVETPRTLAEIEGDAVKHALEMTNGNIALAARQLGVARGTLYKIIEEHGLKEGYDERGKQ